MLWRESVRSALHRFSQRHNTRLITRQGLIDEELGRIVSETESQGLTPHQTLSRVLQELRDAGVVLFAMDGRYVLLDTPLDVETEDYPDDVVDAAIERGKLQIGSLAVGEIPAMARRRQGQDRLRQLTLRNYSRQCALCDIGKPDILVSAHIARWADDPAARGNLANLICMCKFHDTLFEDGYFSLSDDYQILKRTGQGGVLGLLLGATNTFRPPLAYPPGREFLKKHRLRAGF